MHDVDGDCEHKVGGSLEEKEETARYESRMLQQKKKISDYFINFVC